MDFLVNLKPNPSPTCSHSKQGNIPTTLHISSNQALWIVDSSASDHMTHLSHMFSSYTPCPVTLKVHIADGSLLSLVTGKGFVVLSKNLIFKLVLHVPNLSYNHLSISKLTKDSNCMAKFFPSHCEFQDMGSGRMIGSAREVDKLLL